MITSVYLEPLTQERLNLAQGSRIYFYYARGTRRVSLISVVLIILGGAREIGALLRVQKKEMGSTFGGWLRLPEDQILVYLLTKSFSVII